MVYVGGIVMAFLASFLHALDTAGISLVLTQWAQDVLPLYTLGLGWVVPALIGVCVGLLPFWPMNRRTPLL